MKQQNIRRRQIIQQKRLDVLIVLFTLFAAAMMISFESVWLRNWELNLAVLIKCNSHLAM